jgi:hypothetical protein
VGFIIGIEGKNINKIRELSGTRIDVFQQDITSRYRQIELAGSASSVSQAAENIYKIVNKYYFFDHSKGFAGDDNNEKDIINFTHKKRERTMVYRKRLRLNKKSKYEDKVERSPSESKNFYIK